MKKKNELIVLGIMAILLVGCDNDDTIKMETVPIPSKINTRWQRYEIKGCGVTCDDFNWYLLSRETHNKIVCFGVESNVIYNELPCFIPMHFEYDINREYCNFEEGDIIWIITTLDYFKELAEEDVK